MFKNILDSVFSFIRYRIWGSYPHYGVVGLYHWIRCHIWNRYHVINISGMDDYKWGWIDRDHVLLLACFKILREFVEKEDPEVGFRRLADYGVDFITEDPEYRKGIEDHIQREIDIRDLYEWWVTDRPLEWKAIYNKYSHAAMEALQEKDQKMLFRLIALRPYLWT